MALSMLRLMIKNMDPNQLYQQVILAHNKHPRNFGEIKSECLIAEEKNPVCGDEVKLMIDIATKEVKKLSASFDKSLK